MEAGDLGLGVGVEVVGDFFEGGDVEGAVGGVGGGEAFSEVLDD